MSNIQFPFEEQAKRRAITVLQDDWRKALRASNKSGEPSESNVELFCTDGFYPYYFSQAVRVLFIGRESVSLAGRDYIDVLYNAYHCDDVGGHRLNEYPFHKRLLYLTYGLQHGGKIPFDDLPDVMELGKTFATKGGVSFALIELSKYSNERDDASDHRDLNLMTSFLQDTVCAKRLFMQEQIAMLQPHIIVGMNLWGAGLNEKLIASVLGETQFVSDAHKPAAVLCAINVQGKQVPFVDMYHFSSRKDTRSGYYEPLMDIGQQQFQI
ncbi:MAG: hypothetical protein Ta2A_00010 [Treponemataceae bacterium]|nr:MAG: hypothetical protein Ta2A_00010 [Treponemataceae bacterium]